MIAVMITSVASRAMAQGDGKGGFVIAPTIGNGPATLNPIMCDETSCQDLISRMFTGFLGVDPEKMVIAKNVQGALAKDWTISKDGLTYTFKLRNDLKWTDGKPITAKDIEYSYKTMVDPKTGSQLASFFTTIESVTASDDTTLVIKFNTGDCNALSTAGSIPVVPEHVLGEVKPEDIKNNDYSTNPSVTSGVYKFGEYRASEQTTLLPNPDYPDLIGGKIKNNGFIMPVVPDTNVEIEQFLAGQINVLDNVPVDRRADLRKEQAAGKVQLFDYPGNAWDYLALNYADPTDPQPGLDKDGKVVEQKPHPIFGDLAVRQAIATAIDVNALIKGAVFNEGAPMASFVVPSSWAFDKNLKPRAFDPKKAGEMLDKAGWPMGPNGIRVAKGAKFAKDGTEFKFDLMTNAGNTRREAASTLIKDQLKQIGVEVNFTPLDFQVVIDTMNSQKYDAALLGWRQGFPDDPDSTGLYLPQADVPGSGNNFTSYSNPKVTDLMKQALTVPGCAFEDRAKIYKEIQGIMAEDMPYVWLYVINGEYAARSEVKDWKPLPNQLYWNIETWSVESK